MRHGSEHDRGRWLPHVFAGRGRHLRPASLARYLLLQLLTCGPVALRQLQGALLNTRRNATICSVPILDVYKHWQNFVNQFGDDDDMIVIIPGKDRAHHGERPGRHRQRRFKRRRSVLPIGCSLQVGLRSLQNRKLCCFYRGGVSDIHSRHHIKKIEPSSDPAFISWAVDGWGVCAAGNF